MRVIEWLGKPRAGTSTQLHRLERSLIASGKRVAVLSDRTRIKEARIPYTDPFGFNLSLQAAACQEWHAARKDGVDFFLMDRGFVDVRVWAEALLRLDVLRVGESRALTAIGDILAHHVDLTLYFDCASEVCLARHASANRDEHVDADDIVMNREWLDAIDRSYKNNLRKFGRCVRIDGAQSEEQCAADVAEAVWPLLDSHDSGANGRL